MAIKNFIPTLWSEKILKELDKQHMLVKNCTTTYSGKITGLGSKVKINSINTPTIGDYAPNSTKITPEELKDESRMLEIEKAKYFAFYVDDIDEKQSTNGVMEEGLRKAVVGLKDAAEQYIASLYTNAGETIIENSLTSANVFETLLNAKAILQANNVGEGMEIYLEVSPYIWKKMVLADIIYTDTGATIKSGIFSPVLGMKVFLSNNLSTTVNSVDVAQTHCLMRTKEAIGFAEQIMKTEKYMPESSFSEAVKGLHVYGAKVIKPKEFVHLDLTTAAEA
jgi:hypothetical protein